MNNLNVYVFYLASALLFYSTFKRLNVLDKSAMLRVRLSYYLLGVMTAAAVFATLFWTHDPSWIEIGLTTSFALQQMATDVAWKRTYPSQFTGPVPLDFDISKMAFDMEDVVPANQGQTVTQGALGAAIVSVILLGIVRAVRAPFTALVAVPLLVPVIVVVMVHTWQRVRKLARSEYRYVALGAVIVTIPVFTALMVML